MVAVGFCRLVVGGARGLVMGGGGVLVASVGCVGWCLVALPADLRDSEEILAEDVDIEHMFD